MVSDSKKEKQYFALLEAYKQHIGYDKFTEGAQFQFWDELKAVIKEGEFDVDGLKKYIYTIEPKEVFNELISICEISNPKSKKTKNIEDDLIVRTSFLLFDNQIAEEIWDKKTGIPFFLVFNIKSNETKKVWMIDYDGLKYQPIIGEELAREIVILPKKIEDYKDIPTLIEEIKIFINKYYDIDNQHLLFSAWYVLLTWVYDRLNTINYLRALGDFGTGKTRFKETVGRICYKPILGSGAGSVAALKRMVDKWRGTVLTDEGDFRDDDEKNDLIKFYNLGFEKRQCIYQCDKNDPNKIDFFDPFCPKIILTRKAFKDQALESRCLTHITKVTKRKDIPIILPDIFFEEQEVLRSKLLKFRFDYYFKIDTNKILGIDLGNIEMRLKQATISFASLFANIPEVLEEFKQFLQVYQKELIEDRSTSFDGQIINTIAEMLVNEKISIITPSDISERMDPIKGKKPDSKVIGKHLKSLGIQTKREKVEGKTKNLVVINESIADLVKKYVSDEELVTVVTSVTSVMLSCEPEQATLQSVYKEKMSVDLVDVTDDFIVTLPNRALFVLEYIKRNPQCPFLDIKNELKFEETELFKILKNLKKNGEIFEPKVDKYMVV